MTRDKATYGGISRKYDQWVEIQKSKPEPPRMRSNKPYVHEPVESSDMGRTVFAAIGIGIGAILLLLAGLAFAQASRWIDLGRDGATAGWILVGVFLLVAGTGAVLSTWNHNFRVLVNPGNHDH